MICITIAQESRTLALADLLNAAQMGADLLEVRLDSFEKQPNLGGLIAAKRKPLLFSCRRLQDGGNWKGTEDERQMLLRQAILSQADYVEIEWDIADQIRPFPPCKRVVSYTNLKETPADIDAIYEQMRAQQPDVIKLTCRARTPEEAWPLLQILSKPTVPTVVVGLGRPGVMLAVLGHKMGAPWTPAALERGAEAYPGQPTVRDLEEIYHYRDIRKSTRFVGVTGLGEREFLTAGLLNTAFAALELPHRVLPLQVGNLKLFRRVIDAVRLQGVTMEEDCYEKVHEAAFLDETARPPVQAADLLLPGGETGWVGSNGMRRAALAALEAAIRAREPDAAEPLRGRAVMLVGAGPQTRMLAAGLKERGAALVFASKDRPAATRLAQAFSGRVVVWEAIYSTFHDVLIVGRDVGESAEDSPDEAGARLHPGYLRAGMTVLDLTGLPRRTPLLKEARIRGCNAVEPGQVLVEQVRVHVRRMTNQTPPLEPLVAKLAQWLVEE